MCERELFQLKKNAWKVWHIIVKNIKMLYNAAIEVAGGFSDDKKYDTVVW